MSESSRRRKPIIPSVTIVVGLLVGLAGLVMTILGIGGVSATHLSFSNTINIQTTSGGVLAMVIGFGMALFLQVMMIRVDLRAAGQKAAKGEPADDQKDRPSYYESVAYAPDWPEIPPLPVPDSPKVEEPGVQ